MGEQQVGSGQQVRPPVRLPAPVRTSVRARPPARPHPSALLFSGASFPFLASAEQVQAPRLVGRLSGPPLFEEVEAEVAGLRAEPLDEGLPMLRSAILTILSLGRHLACFSNSHSRSAREERTRSCFLLLLFSMVMLLLSSFSARYIDDA